MIPFGPTKGDKDGAWRGGAAFVGVWAILWFLGVMTPLPMSVSEMSNPLGAFVVAFAILGAMMTAPYAWRWISGSPPQEGGKKGTVLYEMTDPSGHKTQVMHPDGPGGWSPPLNKGVNRSLTSRTTIWREVSWVAPVTVGDAIMTTAWNLLLVFLGRAQARRSSGSGRRSYDDGLASDEVSEL